MSTYRYILLCGFVPFTSRQEICAKPLNFPHECGWAAVSPSAMSLIQRMLQRAPDARPSATELLEDSWLAVGRPGQSSSNAIGGASTRPLPGVPKRMQLWNAKRKFKGCLLALIAGQRMGALGE